MHIDTHEPVDSTATIFVPDAITTADESRISFDSSNRIFEGKESLASSLDVASLRGELVQLVDRLYFQSATVYWNETSRSPDIFPVLVDQSFFRQAEPPDASIATQEQVRLAQSLRTAFDAEPLEDGMNHPAEKIIGTALQSPEYRQVLDWFKEFCLDSTHPSFAASILRCLGRQTCPGTESWRAQLVRDALGLEDVEIRDAAVQAAEVWGGQNIRNVLEGHIEPVQWLRNYIRDVSEDLGA